MRTQLIEWNDGTGAHGAKHHAGTNAVLFIVCTEVTAPTGERGPKRGLQRWYQPRVAPSCTSTLFRRQTGVLPTCLEEIFKICQLR